MSREAQRIVAKRIDEVLDGIKINGMGARDLAGLALYALTAANLIIVPRAVVESCRSTALCLNNAKLARALDECMSGDAADEQGAG